MAEAAAVVDGEILTMIEDMIEAMTDMKITITGTEEGRLLLITVDTGHGQDLVPIAQDAIDNDNGVVVAKDFFFLLFLFDSGFPSFQYFLVLKTKPWLFNLYCGQLCCRFPSFVTLLMV